MPLPRGPGPAHHPASWPHLDQCGAAPAFCHSPLWTTKGKEPSPSLLLLNLFPKIFLAGWSMLVLSTQRNVPLAEAGSGGAPGAALWQPQPPTSLLHFHPAELHGLLRVRTRRRSCVGSPEAKEWAGGSGLPPARIPAGLRKPWEDGGCRSSLKPSGREAVGREDSSF